METKKVKYERNDKDVTIEEARGLANFENASDQEVQHVLDSLKIFCTVAYRIISRSKMAHAPENDPEHKQAA